MQNFILFISCQDQRDVICPPPPFCWYGKVEVVLLKNEVVLLKNEVVARPSLFVVLKI